MKNTKFSNEIPSRLASLIEKLQISWKFTDISKNSQNRQIFMKIRKLIKNTENIKFSIKMPYRLVPLPEKLDIFHCSIEKLQISSKILNFSENEEIIKFSSRILSHSVIFTEKFPIFMFSSRILSRSVLFTEKLQFS